MSWAIPRGYRFAGGRCGIRGADSRKDLALIVSDLPAAAAGVFTQNRVCAAPVQVSRQRVPQEQARGIVVCSGNANACTGEQGRRDAWRMTELLAELLQCPVEQVLVCSTGIIGRPLPMDCIESGIRSLAAQLSATPEAVQAVAEAILTTDSRPKIAGRTLNLAGKEVRILGWAKGAAMIGPNLATMLAFLLSDARVAASDLDRMLRRAVDGSFQCISVDGHTSTNDTVLALANGAAGDLRLTGKELECFEQALTEVCEELARAIVADAEGAAHLITLEVQGTRTVAEARQIAQAVANSPLVKTAIFGGDPNWGRIVSAAGYAGVDFREEDLSLWIGEFLLYERGRPVPFPEAEVSRYLRQNREVIVRLRFDLGSAACRFWTSDLTYDYVRLNAEYTT
ncbi:MAG: bifunctional glutamate N-acetyltransferase/amino-acid acetyltransferase ArgJ [Gemmatales bacterium]|nr:bifunctional glutamate N-acetyltransferase/amino-acid acetyltransferase ArgJ [Gemmatales bacterium]MDW7993205.1 bifunctional glutamate N-acetyltransferase/amino-acid acetyltransferase ArgJ [Gemmatales bacterium]